ncbi:MAG: hypothetical protein KF816_16785 [Melioribacteraceae bacterium]|jgi:hypothetical protein|nr:hypothetical protein [Melioribacteraceae bacterium]
MKPYIKITLVYFLFGSLWIFFSDRILQLMADIPDTLTLLQTFKGWFYIIITSFLLFFMMRFNYEKKLSQEKEKIDLFYSTMRAVHHILNNFLNKMQFFKYAAEESGNFKEEVLAEYDRVIQEASQEIQKLSAINNITKDEIQKTVFDQAKFINSEK